MSSKTFRIQVKRRRFGFKFGLSAAAVKEYQTGFTPLISFAIALDAEREPGEVRKLIRGELLRRIGGGKLRHY